MLTPLHISARYGHIEVVRVMLPVSEINKQDQYGFTALHYATVNTHNNIVKLLLEHGAMHSITSKAGSTALDLAQSMKTEDIIKLLLPLQTRDKDPNLPKFSAWLHHLNAAEYLPFFLEAGYDLRFIAKEGIGEEDLNCVQIPLQKMGLRRKLLKLTDLQKFYELSDSEKEESEESGEEEEENTNESEEEDD
mmetsp:Transcript_38574/g.39262  ORF Transcript_38574/g.39262 Transcript_38574/m.39262 type:complete len:192 (-) Transcript_38574:130-705(-)